MPTGQTLALALTALVECIILAGLISRQRLSRCLGFTAYIASVLLHTVMVLTFPDTFGQFVIWRYAQIVYASLRHVMALELALHTFRAFPVARRLARSFLWVMSVLALATPFMFGSDLTSLTTMLLDVVPRMNLAAVGLFTGLGVLILWYRLPLDPMHKAVIMGIVPYLAIYSVLLRAARDLGSKYFGIMDYTNQFAWIIVTVFWAWVAWQPRRQPASARPVAPWSEPAH